MRRTNSSPQNGFEAKEGKTGKKLRLVNFWQADPRYEQQQPIRYSWTPTGSTAASTSTLSIGFDIRQGLGRGLMPCV
jgi:hypothetical protein